VLQVSPKDISMPRRAFTLIELLVVIAVIALLIGIMLPMLGKSRETGRTMVCLSNLRTLSQGWDLYADTNKDIMPGGRMVNLPGGKSNPLNWYEIGTGSKFRPSWIATIGSYVGVYPFNDPYPADHPEYNRQDYDSKVYQCPVTPDWADERNHCYGYNFQFLGNARQSNGKFINYPRRRANIQQFAITVMAGDGLGTAGAFPRADRIPYINNGPDDYRAVANEGFNLDPPRLTSTSDRCSTSYRSGPDPRHFGKSNFVFLDHHAETRGVVDMGYGVINDGKYIDLDAATNELTNRFFSGTGGDDDPPDLPL